MISKKDLQEIQMVSHLTFREIHIDGKKVTKLVRVVEKPIDRLGLKKDSVISFLGNQLIRYD